MSDPVEGFIHTLVEMGSEPPRPSDIPEGADTDTVLAIMLTENTGRHMLDSGGAYGRAWEHNQAEAGDDPVAYFRSRPEVKISPFCGPIVDVFHFLSDRLDYAPELDARFHAWAAGSKEPWLVDMEEFAKVEGWGHPFGPERGFITVNTYNGEDALSQTLQYTAGRVDDDDYVILQIHGGADVRGGYSTPHIFRAGYNGVESMLDNARLTLTCDDCHLVADSENAGYSFDLVDSCDLPVDDTKMELARAGEGDDQHFVCPVCGSDNINFHPWPAG